MELAYLTIFFLLGGALAEPTFNVLISQNKIKPGSEVTVTCRASNLEDSTIVKIRKYVEIDELDESSNKKVFEEDIALNTELEPQYQKTLRHSITSTSNGATGTDYILRIEDVNEKDSATYACSAAGSTSHASKTLVVYTQPDNVHFTNYSNWDLNVDIMHLDEGETVNVGCMAMGGVPVPRFELVVGEANYTQKFKHHESETVLPDCYVEGASDNCELHYSTVSEVEATNFRPHYTADGQFLECKAYVDGSGKDPKTAKVMVAMRYKPKFFCFEKHKVAMHETNYELKCNVLTNPYLQTVKFEFQLDGKNEVLTPGQKTIDGGIEFMKLDRTSDTETQVVLKFKQIYERHYDSKYELFANNDLGSNSTILELVSEDYVRGSADMVVCSGILALISCVMSFFML